MSNEPSFNGEHALERRAFLKFLIVALNALIGVLLAVPGLGYILTPILRKTEQDWIRVGRVSDLSRGSFRKTVFRYVSAAGYTRQEKRAFVWMRQEDSGDITAFSPKCTHMGCNVAWNPESRLFECPCHGGRYDEQGRVVAGPPPRPLDRYQVRVENDLVYLKRSEA